MRGRLLSLQRSILQRPLRSECGVTLLETPDTYGLRAFAVTDPGGHYVLAPSNQDGEPNPFKIAVPLTDGPALCWQGHLAEVKT